MTCTGVRTAVTVDDVTADDVLITTAATIPMLMVGSAVIRPPKSPNARTGVVDELEEIAAWGRAITAQAEAHLSLHRERAS